jgi:hypothetical protein
MAFPRLGNARIDKQVTNILSAYTNNDFIAGMILPSFPVTEESGIVPSIGNSHLRIRDNRRALWDRSSHELDFTYSNDAKYNIEYYDLDMYMPDRFQNQQQAPFNIRRDAGIVIMQNLMLEREALLASLMTNTAVLTNNVTLTGSDQYSDPSSTPLADMEAGRTSVYEKTGSEANAMMIGRKVFNTLKDHPDFANKVRGSNDRLSGALLKQLLAEYLEIPVENIYIGKSIKITSNEGQTETKSVVWGNDIVLFRKAEDTAMFQPSFGYGFTLTGENLRASTFRHHENHGDMERVEWAYDDYISDANCAYLIKNAVA